MTKSPDPSRLSSRPFRAQAHLLCAGLLSRLPAFTQTLRQLHDRLRTNVRRSSSCIRKACPCGPDRPSTATEPQRGAADHRPVRADAPAPSPPEVVLDPELLRQLHQECDGYAQRMMEKLREEHGIAVKYSTLTRHLRELGISLPPEPRAVERVPDEPGAEMQHDTSPFTLLVGSQRLRLQASLLYLRYSKRRYLQFYPVFDRFHMKCFLHLALMHWGYAPPVCVIDNTNLARWRGLGAHAVMVPEMEAFARSYGFRFLCHAPKHSDRKAGEERSFLTVETNFIPGRTFASLEDLNRQALEWSTVRMEQRPQGKAGLIPAQAFAISAHCRDHLRARATSRRTGGNTKHRTPNAAAPASPARMSCTMGGQPSPAVITTAARAAYADRRCLNHETQGPEQQPTQRNDRES